MTDGKPGNTGLLPPLKASLGMTIQELLAIPELEICDVAITPPCVAALYNITKATKATPGNQLGIFEDLGDYFSQTDLNLFWATFEQSIPQGTGPTLEAIDGAEIPANNVATAGPESDLDYQISYPIIYPQKSILFQTDDPIYEANYTFEGFLNNFLYALDGSYCKNGSSALDPPYPDPQAGGYKGALQCGKYTPVGGLVITEMTYTNTMSDKRYFYLIRRPGSRLT